MLKTNGQNTTLSYHDLCAIVMLAAAMRNTLILGMLRRVKFRWIDFFSDTATQSYVLGTGTPPPQ